MDPAAVVERRSRAEADRCVSLRPAPDVMARLSTLLPATRGWRCGQPCLLLDQARAAGDPRTRGQVMADTLVERITGQATAEGVYVTVDLVVSDETLLAGGTARDGCRATARCPRRPPTTWSAGPQRTPAQPCAASTRPPQRVRWSRWTPVARDFPAGLATFLDLRDRTCRTVVRCPDPPPRPRRRHADGGETSGPNGRGCASSATTSGEAPGWTARPATGPPGGPTSWRPVCRRDMWSRRPRPGAGSEPTSRRGVETHQRPHHRVGRLTDRQRPSIRTAPGRPRARPRGPGRRRPPGSDRA